MQQPNVKRVLAEMPVKTVKLDPANKSANTNMVASRAISTAIRVIIAARRRPRPHPGVGLPSGPWCRSKRLPRRDGVEQCYRRADEAFGCLEATQRPAPTRPSGSQLRVEA